MRGMAEFTGGQAAAARAVVARRAELGFTQSDLADVSVVSLRSIRNLEAGRHWPQPATRNKIERALGWPIGRLADIAEQKDRAEGANPYTGDEAELYEVLSGLDMPEADRHMLVSVYRMHRTGRDDRALIQERIRASIAERADDDGDSSLASRDEPA